MTFAPPSNLSLRVAIPPAVRNQTLEGQFASKPPPRAAARRSRRADASMSKSGPKAFGPPLRARIRACLEAPAPPLPKIFGTLIEEQMRFNWMKAEEAQQRIELEQGLKAMELVAKNEKWSKRKLATEAGLSWTTWRRLRNGQMPLPHAIQWLRSALTNLNLNPTADYAI